VLKLHIKDCCVKISTALVNSEAIALDFLFGVITIGLFLVTLISAAVLDVRKGEVPNLVWFIGLVALPLAVYRLFTSGLILVYCLQLLFAFTLVIVSFRVGLLGGADGKAILVTSLVYPWLDINQITLVYAPILIFVGAYLVVGIQCVTIYSLNIMKHHQYSLHQKNEAKPNQRRYWFTRRIPDTPSETGDREWRRVAVPLVLYILLAYLTMLLFGVLWVI
jgi:Flp pilus assembly protein protease CpaA